MRLIRHIAPGNSPKSMALKTMVRHEFYKGKDEKDPEKIDALKANAIRALSNYMLYESGSKDMKLGKAMKKFNDDTNATSTTPTTKNSSSRSTAKDPLSTPNT